LDGGNFFIPELSCTTAVTIGANVTGNRYAYLDFVGDDTYTDYGLRIIRNNGGVNTESNITHRGTGHLNIVTEDSGSSIHIFPATDLIIG
jgi:sugar/nucleoside kinase (ribokinase family)